jgi:hypothetical protein
MFQRLHIVVTGAAAVLALVPGASLMTKALELPVAFDGALGFMAAVVGPIVFFLVFLARPAVLGLGTRRLIAIIAATALAGLGLGMGANEYAQARTDEYRFIDHHGTEQVVHFLVPETFGAELTRRLARDGNDLDNALKRDREDTLHLLSEDARPVRLKLAAGFLSAQTLLIFAFLCAAWAVAERSAGPADRGEEPAAAPAGEPLAES